MQPVVHSDAKFLGALGEIDVETTAFGSTPCAVVSVRRAIDGHASVESWILDPRMTEAFDAECRREARMIADGTSVVGETLVVFGINASGEPAVAQIAHGALAR